MGQTSSQEIQESPVSPVKKVPPRPHEPPKLQLQPTARPPSYAIPENKVLPTELPSRPLRAVSAAFAKSNPELENLSADKENTPLENGSVNLDHNFFSDSNKPEDKNDQNKDVVVLRNKEKYKAPNPPIVSVSPSGSGEKTETIPIDQFFNRAALAHRRTHSLDRLSGNRVKGHNKRPVSAVNLTSSEHTIFEDPEEINQNNKYTSLPQKSTFPLDYAYAVTYAQLAGHRRKKVQPKLDAEKEVLLKRQSLPDLKEKRNMDQNVDMYLIRDGEIDLDNTTPPRRKKYRAPAPPPNTQVSTQAILLQIPSSGSSTRNISTSTHKKQEAPTEPPVDYDTGETAHRNAIHKKQAVQSFRQNQEVLVLPMSSDKKVTLLKTVCAKEPIDIYSNQTEASSPKLIIQTESVFEPASPGSPKSPPPPVKPKPVRSPDEGRFRFPNSPTELDSDVITVNGQVIPEVRSHCPVQGVVSLNIDAKSETVQAAIVPQIVNTLLESVDVNKLQYDISSKMPPVTPNAGSIRKEDRGTIHLSGERKSNETPARSKTSSAKSIIHQNSVDGSTPNRGSPLHHFKGDTKVLLEKQLSTAALSNGLGVHPVQMGTPAVHVEPIPTGIAADIVLETQFSSVGNSDPPIMSQSRPGSDSGVNMPLSDQSFESFTTGDRSMEMDGIVTVTDDEMTSTTTAQITQGTMTMTPEIEDRREPVINIGSLDCSLSTLSSDSAKAMSPPLTPDDNEPPKMNSLLQNDIVAAAQVRVLKLKKPESAPPPPKHPEEMFKEELAKLHKEREGRLTKSSVDKSGNLGSENIQGENSKDDVSTDKDTDSGIQACSFSEDWTPEHDLEDSDEGHRSAHTSRSGFFYDGRTVKTPVKPTNSSSSNGRVLRKSDSDVSDKFGSLRRFRQNVHKSVKHALSSVNKQSNKASKLSKRSSLPPPVPLSSEPQQPVFRKLNPDAPQKHFSETNRSILPVEHDGNMKEERVIQSDTDQQIKKAGVAYVSGNGQIVLLPNVESPKSFDKPLESEDSHRAPKRWKKVKKFAYMATTRKKEKQRVEQLLKERVEEQERRIEAERQKQLEMEHEFKKVRQVDKPVIKPEFDEINMTPIKNGKPSKEKSTTEISHNAVDPLEGKVTVNDTPQRQVALNGAPQEQVTVNGCQTTVASFTMPGLVQAPNLTTTDPTALNPILLSGQAYNPWVAAQPVQNLAYPTAMGWSIPNYATVPSQYTTSLPYDLNNYMQMLDINGQPVNMPLANGLINGYNMATQSMDLNQTKLLQYHKAPGLSNGQLQPQNSVDNYNNNRSLKHSIYMNPGPIDDLVLNQIYQTGNGNPRNDKEKKRSNPLYFSSDEEEEYDVSDVHSGRTHSKGTVARISVPDHHYHHRPPVHYADEEMSSPCSITSSSADSSTPNFPPKLYSSVAHQTSVPSAHFQSMNTSDAVNLDESYSSADR